MRIRIITAVPTAEKKKRVCAYARVSTDSRRQEESLENQTATYERLIRSNPEYEFAGVYADQGISGYCENRPQFQKMLERVRAGGDRSDHNKVHIKVCTKYRHRSES